MSNTFAATPRRLALVGAMLALLGSGSLSSIAQVQQPSGSNLILDTDRNRAPGEPRGVITSGGPSADEVKRRLQQRIEEQSDGQIGLAIRTWAIDNNGHFPFNVSTNAGGTLELCVRGSDGFDSNAPAHFQVMSNELGDARYLICPADSSKRPASNFVKLRPANISYLLRSGPNVEETHPEEILARCPIHGNVLLCDGSVKKGPVKESDKASPPSSGGER